MKIVLLEGLAISQEKLEKCAAPFVAEGHVFEAYDKNTDPQVQIQRAKDADVIMIANMPLKGEVIRACPNLKFINVAFTGVDHVDLEAAKEMGVAVSNASGYSNESVAELVLGMMLTLLRNVPQVDEKCRQGGTKDGLVGRELKGKTVGIVGYGAIGSRVAQLCNAFGTKVIAYDPSPRGQAESYVTFTTLEEVMAESDIVTVHCPLMDSTRGLIGEKEIGLMKKRAYLINCARGPIVDTAALAAALNEERIAGAGVDVFEIEPPLNVDHPLLHTKNTIVTPHIAFASDESMELRADIVFDSMKKWMDGNQINKIL